MEDQGLARLSAAHDAADALIASSYLAGTNTRRVRRALAALFGGAIGKDVVSRTWRKVKTDWDAWNARSLADEPIVRLILDGTVVRVRLDRKATSISLLVVNGERADGQKILLAVKNMGGETTEAWRAILDDLVGRGLRRPEFLIVDGAPGLDRAIAALWDGVSVQRCTVHKHRNLLAHAPTGGLRTMARRMPRSAPSPGAEGHDVVRVSRRKPGRADEGKTTVVIDMAKALVTADWSHTLQDVDVVVNCAGVLQDSAGEHTTKVHTQRRRCFMPARRPACAGPSTFPLSAWIGSNRHLFSVQQARQRRSPDEARSGLDRAEALRRSGPACFRGERAVSRARRAARPPS
jgi:hypothetical protein